MDRWSWMLWSVLLVVGCQEKPVAEGVVQRLGEVGQSCGKGADCGEGLVCVEQVCAEKVEPVAAAAGAAVGSAAAGYLGKAKVESCRVQLSMLSTNLEMYYAFNDEYPETLKRLLAKDKLVKADQLVDPWDRPLSYKVEGETFKLCSWGPDGESGSSDDICWLAEEEEEVEADAPPPCPVLEVILDCGKDGCAMELPFLEKVDELHVALSVSPRVKSVASIGYLLRRIHFVVSDSKGEFDVVPESEEARAQLLLLVEMGSEENLVPDLMNVERSQVALILELATASSDEIEWLEGEAARLVVSSLTGTVGAEVIGVDDCQLARETLGELVRLGESVRVEEGSVVFGGGGVM